MKALMRYPGAKWGLVDEIIKLMPPHKTYLELFSGSAAVLFNKNPSAIETINDLDNDVVNLFKILKDFDKQVYLQHQIRYTPFSRKFYDEAWIVSEEDTDIEKAYKFLIKGLMSHGFRLTEKSGWKSDVIGRETSYGVRHWNELPDLISMAFNRLKNVQIEHQDALKLIDRYSHKDIFIYIDPPYVLSTRTRKQYKHEMTDEQHIQLLEKIIANKSKIMISGYDNEIYNRYLKDWYRYEFKTTVEKGHPRTDVIWINYEIENKLF